MNKLFIYILILLHTTSTFAGCVNNVTLLNKGQASPCKGFLFSEQKEEEVKNIYTDYKLLKEESELYKKKEDNYKESLKIKDLMYKEQSEISNLYHTKLVETTKEYIKSQDGRGTRDLLFFSAGVLAVLLSSIIVKNVVK